MTQNAVQHKDIWGYEIRVGMRVRKVNNSSNNQYKVIGFSPKEVRVDTSWTYRGTTYSKSKTIPSCYLAIHPEDVLESGQFK